MNSLREEVTSMQKEKDTIIVIYDGECPFCANYVALMNLRNAVGRATLIDARTGAAPVKLLVERGYDLNEGMAVIFGDSVYYGKDAVTFLSALTNSRNWAGGLLAKLLSSPGRAAVLYPVMKLGRRITLRVLGKPPLRH
jgi:predicted DCC family thiol-disulfide oxidoreductase YuxK